MAGIPPHVHRIRRLNIWVLAAMSLLSLATGEPEIVGAVTLGGVVSLVNFELLMRINTGFLTPGHNPGVLVAKVLVKFTALMLLVSGLLIALPLNPIAFALGFSLIFVSIGVSGLLSLRGSPSTDPESTDA